MMRVCVSCDVTLVCACIILIHCNCDSRVSSCRERGEPDPVGRHAARLDRDML